MSPAELVNRRAPARPYGGRRSECISGQARRWFPALSQNARAASLVAAGGAKLIALVPTVELDDWEAVQPGREVIKRILLTI
jgi:hypothetical protein